MDGIAEVNLLTRHQDIKGWQTQRAAHAGRSVFTAQLGPFQKDDSAIEYYATAANNSQLFCDPPQAPRNAYTLNVLA